MNSENKSGSESDENITIDSVTSFEMSILAEINFARSNPKTYFETYIQPLQSRFSSEYFNSCKSDMSGTANLGRLTYKEGLYKVAKYHVLTQGKTTSRGHKRTNEKTFETTIKESGTFSYAGENISYGESTARGIVIQLLVDDQVKDLGHRKNMLSTNYDSAGVGYGDHKSCGHMCVIDFAKNWVDK